MQTATRKENVKRPKSDYFLRVHVHAVWWVGRVHYQASSESAAATIRPLIDVTAASPEEMRIAPLPDLVPLAPVGDAPDPPLAVCVMVITPAK